LVAHDVFVARFVPLKMPFSTLVVYEITNGLIHVLILSILGGVPREPEKFVVLRCVP
jgi:hypothetical protein